MLKLLVEIRFYMHFYVLKNMLKNKDAIKEMFSWTLYRRWEEVQKQSVWNKSAEMKRIVYRDLF